MSKYTPADRINPVPKFEIVPRKKFAKRSQPEINESLPHDVKNFMSRNFSSKSLSDNKCFYSNFRSEKHFGNVPMGRFIIGSDWQFPELASSEQEIPMMLIEASPELKALLSKFIPEHVRTLIVSIPANFQCNSYNIHLIETVESLIIKQIGTISRIMRVHADKIGVKEIVYFNAHLSILDLDESVEKTLEKLSIVGDHCCGINGYNLDISHLKINSFATTICPACISGLPESLQELRLVIESDACLVGFQKLFAKHEFPNLDTIEVCISSGKYEADVIAELKKLPKLEISLITSFKSNLFS